MRRLHFAILALLVAPTCPQLAAAAGAQPAIYDPPIREHTFDNGLRLLVLERPGDHRVAAKIFTRMGALNEVPGELGAAHFLEHLMFKGTPSLGTTDWAAERPIRERIDALETELIQELNRARNDVRRRGVFDDPAHHSSTPAADSLRAEIARMEDRARPYREHGATMRWYQRYGGTNLTATTEQEYMKFDINLPVERIEVFFRVEADRMTNTVFREFDEERMILVEQRYGDLNRPTTPYYEAMNSLVGRIHPVFWPEGYPTDFEQYTRAYQRHLYETFFVPNNTTLVLIGGVSLESMIPLVDRYFGMLPRGPEPPRVQAVEPTPDAERRLLWRTAGMAPRVEARFLIPAVGHPDRPYFDVLGAVAHLMLRRALDDAGIDGTPNVNTTVVHTSRFGVPASQNFELVLKDPAKLDAAERVLIDTLDRIARGDISRADLALARKQLRAEWHRRVREPDVLAFDIGHFGTMDEWQTLAPYIAARDRTTASDIARIARRHFVPENRSIGVVLPPDRAATRNEGGR